MLGVAGFFVFGGKSKPNPDVDSSNTATVSEAAKPQPVIKVRENDTSAASAARGTPIDLLSLVDVKRDAITGEWSRDSGDLVVKAAKPGASGTPRFQLPYQPPEEYDFEIEFTPESGTSGTYQILSASQRSFAWVLDAKLSAGVKAGFDRIDGQLISGRTNGTTMKPKFLTNGQRHRSTVEVRKTGVRALLDGVMLVSYSKNTGTYQTLDSSPNEAMRDTLHLGLAAYDRGVRYHKLTVREITGAGKIDAAASKEDLPNLTNWQDVTSVLREKAGAKPGLVVETDAVRRDGGNAPAVSVLLTKESTPERALRVRFSRGVQVSLWSTNGGGAAAVIVINNRVGFQRQRTATSPAESFGPNVPHPASFDFAMPHELIVTVQGSTLRTWLDGRFIGEAQDEMVKETTFALAFYPGSTVQKVEIAELDGETAKGAWQPIFMKPEDFGGDLRDVEFRDGATFLKSRSKAAPATSSGGGIRSTLRFCASDRTGSFSLRSMEGAAYGEEDFACMAYVAPSGGMVMKVRDRSTGNPELKRHDFPLSPALKPEESFSFELRAADGKITASINGHEVGSVPDTWKGGARRFSITPSTTEMTEFRDVAVMKSGG